MKPLTLEWIKKAEGDFDAAKLPGLSVDIVCFHAQQAVEKYLKGFLYEADIRFPKTHELVVLLELALNLQPLWEAWRTSFRRLSEFAAEFRYPGEWANEKDAITSLRIATEFRTEIRRVMGIE